MQFCSLAIQKMDFLGTGEKRLNLGVAVLLGITVLPPVVLLGQDCGLNGLDARFGMRFRTLAAG